LTWRGLRQGEVSKNLKEATEMKKKKVLEKRNFKRVLVVSDLHCGHRAGLTHPDHWVKGSAYFEQQKKTWNFFEEGVKSLGKIDILVCNGDAIDGKGDKSGGTEQIETDRGKQVDIAEKCLKWINAGENRFIYGTPYHTGIEEDWERELALRLKSEIRGHDFFEVNGVKFDVKHKIGSSTIPHGRYTPIAKEKLWNTIWADRGGQVKADITIRSHVHYYLTSGNANWTGIVTPALQGFGSKYGVRQCSGTVDYGFIWIDIYPDGSKSIGVMIMDYEVVELNGTFESRLKG
jgi:hypothetical protein